MEALRVTSEISASLLQPRLFRATPAPARSIPEPPWWPPATAGSTSVVCRGRQLPLSEGPGGGLS